MTVKERLHRLIDALPQSEWHAAERFLEFLHGIAADPLMRLLDEAPEDDEEPTPDEEAAAREGWEAYLRGEHITAEEAKRELLS